MPHLKPSSPSCALTPPNALTLLSSPRPSLPPLLYPKRPNPPLFPPPLPPSFAQFPPPLLPQTDAQTCEAAFPKPRAARRRGPKASDEDEEDDIIFESEFAGFNPYFTLMGNPNFLLVGGA